MCSKSAAHPTLTDARQKKAEPRQTIKTSSWIRKEPFSACKSKRRRNINAALQFLLYQKVFGIKMHQTLAKFLWNPWELTLLHEGPVLPISSLQPPHQPATRIEDSCSEIFPSKSAIWLIFKEPISSEISHVLQDLSGLGIRQFLQGYLPRAMHRLHFLIAHPYAEVFKRELLMFRTKKQLCQISMRPAHCRLGL